MVRRVCTMEIKCSVGKRKMERGVERENVKSCRRNGGTLSIDLFEGKSVGWMGSMDREDQEAVYRPEWK